MQKPDAIRVQHMLDAIQEALGFVEGKTRQDLDKDRMLVLTLVKEVEIIGEASAKVDKAFKERTADIPWKDMALMRNRLIHVYFDVDLDVVWETVQHDLPELKRKLEALLPTLL